jgi:outer membrane immunogenic protein
MKRVVVAAALAACFTAPSLAADFPRVPVRAPAVMVPVVYNWTGFYLGVHTGGLWGDKDWTAVSSTGIPLTVGSIGSHGFNGWIVGGQVGFNWQFGSVVVGLEGQWSWTNADGNHICNGTPSATCTTDLNWIASAAARVGVAFDRLLIYVKGGAAWADDDFTAAITGIGSVTSGHIRNGWMVGGGLEYGLTDHFSGKLEYNYMDLGDHEVVFVRGPASARVSVDQVLHVVKLGLNFRFGGGSVVQRY